MRISQVPTRDGAHQFGFGEVCAVLVLEVTEQVGHLVREHTGRRRADGSSPVVVHEAELVGKAVERGGPDAAARVFLRAVVEYGVADRVGEAVVAEERDELEVV